MIWHRLLKFTFLFTLLFLVITNTQSVMAAVSQEIGYYDTQFTYLTNADCINCHGGNTSDRHHATYQGVNSNCSYCHMSNTGLMEVNRECRSCHFSIPHHQSSLAASGDCATCHSPDVVSSIVYDPGTYDPPSPVLPAQCRNCHSGDTDLSPPIGESRDLHHDLNLTCNTCHNPDNSPNIRKCEQCHLPSTLHNLHETECSGCHTQGNPSQLPPAPVKPSINTLSETSGWPGDTVTISGTNFGSIPGSLKIGLTSAEIVSWLDDCITFTVPKITAGNYEVTVVNVNGTSNIKVYTIIPDPETSLSSKYGFPDKLYADLTEFDCRECHGSTVDRHHTTLNANNCLQCHQGTASSQSEMVNDDVYNPTTIIRDCKICHTTGRHHTSPFSIAGACSTCHPGTLIEDWGSVAPPLTVPDGTLPTPASCTNCHTTPTNSQLHHPSSENCLWCHDETEIYPIRTCENCHSETTLHNVTSHLKPSNCAGCHSARPDEFPSLPSSNPEIHGLSTNSGGPGTTLVIAGNNFGELLGKVYLATYNATVVEWTYNQVIATVPNIPIGNYMVFVENSAGKSNGLDFTVTTPGAISGKVTDVYNNVIANAKIIIGTKYANSDDTGTYTITGLAKGTYTVQVSASDYTSLTQNVNILDNLTITRNFTMQVGPSRYHPVAATGYEASPNVACYACHATNAVTQTTDLVQIHQNAGIPNFNCDTCHNPTYEGKGKVISADGVMDMKIRNQTPIYCNSCHGPSAPAKHTNYVPHGSAQGFDVNDPLGDTGCGSCHTSLELDLAHSTMMANNNCNICHTNSNSLITELINNNLSTSARPGYYCQDCHPTSTHGDLQTEHTSTFALSQQWDCSQCHNSYLPDTHQSVSQPETVAYKIYRSTDGVNFSQIGLSTSTSYVSGALNPNTNYFYKVNAYDKAGNVSPFSNVATVTTPAVSLVDTDFKPTTADYGDRINADTASDNVKPLSPSTLYRLTNGTDTFNGSSDVTIQENGSYDKWISVKLNHDAKNYTTIKLKVRISWANKDSVGNILVYPYKTDGRNINTSAVINYKLANPTYGSSGFTDYIIDVTNAAKTQANWGWMKFRIKTGADGSVRQGKVSEARVILPTSTTQNTSSSTNTSITTIPGADTVPPTTPTNLTAATINETGVNLNWSVSTDSGGTANDPSCALCHNSTKAKVVAAINNTATDGSNRLCASCHTGTFDGAGAIHTDITTPHLDGIFPTATDSTCINCHSLEASEFVSTKGAFHVANNLLSNADTNWGSYLSPWTATSTVGCQGCHGNNQDGKAQALNILKRPYNYLSNSGQADMLCFLCHNRSYYGYGSDSIGKSGFSKDDKNLHNIGDHKVNNIVQCSWCHTSKPHSTSKAHLIVTQSDSNSTGNMLTSYTHPASGQYQTSSCGSSASKCDEH